MRSYLITLETNKNITQYVVDCTCATMTEKDILESFIEYDILFAHDEYLVNVEMRKL